MNQQSQAFKALSQFSKFIQAWRKAGSPEQHHEDVAGDMLFWRKSMQALPLSNVYEQVMLDGNIPQRSNLFIARNQAPNPSVLGRYPEQHSAAEVHALIDKAAPDLRDTLLETPKRSFLVNPGPENILPVSHLVADHELLVRLGMARRASGSQERILSEVPAWLEGYEPEWGQSSLAVNIYQRVDGQVFRLATDIEDDDAYILRSRRTLKTLKMPEERNKKPLLRRIRIMSDRDIATDEADKLINELAENFNESVVLPADLLKPENAEILRKLGYDAIKHDGQVCLLKEGLSMDVSYARHLVMKKPEHDSDSIPSFTLEVKSYKEELHQKDIASELIDAMRAVLSSMPDAALIATSAQEDLVDIYPVVTGLNSFVAAVREKQIHITSEHRDKVASGLAHLKEVLGITGKSLADLGTGDVERIIEAATSALDSLAEQGVAPSNYRFDGDESGSFVKFIADGAEYTARLEEVQSRSEPLYVLGEITPPPPLLNLIKLHLDMAKHGYVAVPKSSDSAFCSQIINALKAESHSVGVFSYLELKGERFSTDSITGRFVEFGFDKGQPIALLESTSGYKKNISESELYLFGVKPFEPKKDDNQGWDNEYYLPSNIREANRIKFQKDVVEEVYGKPAYSGTGSSLIRMDGSIGFDHKFTASGVSQEGYGTYFALGPSAPRIASSYAYAEKDEHNKIGGSDQPNVTVSYLRLRKPIKVGDLATLPVEHIAKIIDMSPERNMCLSNFGEVDLEGEAPIVNRAIEVYSDLPVHSAYMQLAADFHHQNPGYSRLFKEITGYDGVIHEYKPVDGDAGRNDAPDLIVNMFDAERDVKSVFASRFDGQNNDIRFSISHGHLFNKNEAVLTSLFLSDNDHDQNKKPEFLPSYPTDLDSLLRRKAEAAQANSDFISGRISRHGNKVTNTMSFKSWFAGSKAVGSDNDPLVFFRGGVNLDSVVDDSEVLYTSPATASIKSRYKDIQELELLRKNMIPNPVDEQLGETAQVPFFADISTIPDSHLESVVACDEGVVRLHADRSWDLIENYVVDYDKYPDDEASVCIKVGRNNHTYDNKVREFERVSQYFGEVYGGIVQPLFVNTKNPKIIDSYMWEKMTNESDIYDLVLKNAQSEGYDSIIVNDDNNVVCLITMPGASVKLAIGNNGKFDRERPDIRFSLADPGLSFGSRLGSGYAGSLPSRLSIRMALLSKRKEDLSSVFSAIKRIQPLTSFIFERDNGAELLKAPTVQAFIDQASSSGKVLADFALTTNPERKVYLCDEDGGFYLVQKDQSGVHVKELNMDVGRGSSADDLDVDHVTSLISRIFNDVLHHNREGVEEMQRREAQARRTLSSPPPLKSSPGASDVFEDADLLELAKIEVGLEGSRRFATTFESSDADFWFEMSERHEKAVDRLIARAANDKNFEGMMMPSTGGVITVTPSAKAPGFWQKTYFDKNMIPLSDDGAQEKEEALRDFFEDCLPSALLNDKQVLELRAQALAVWAKDSVIKDDLGLPLRVYHGTGGNFVEFKEGVSYFTTRTDYSYIRKSNLVMPCYLNITNPYKPERQSFIETLRNNPDKVQELKAQGYDGVIWAKEGNLMKGPSGWGNDYPQIVVFSPEQIKSAIGNRGTYSELSADIRFSLKPNEPSAAELHASGLDVLALHESDISQTAATGGPLKLTPPEKVSEGQRFSPVRIDVANYVSVPVALRVLAKAGYMGGILSDDGAMLPLAAETLHSKGIGAVIADEVVYATSAQSVRCGMTGQRITEKESPLMIEVRGSSDGSDRKYALMPQPGLDLQQLYDDEIYASMEGAVGETKIQDENGKPKLFAVDWGVEKSHGNGIYLKPVSPSEGKSSPLSAMCVVRSENPLDLRLVDEASLAEYFELDKTASDLNEMIRKAAIKQGYDSIIFENEDGEPNIVSFDVRNVINMDVVRTNPAIASSLYINNSVSQEIEMNFSISEINEKQGSGNDLSSTIRAYIPATGLSPVQQLESAEALRAGGLPVYESKAKAWKDGYHSVAEIEINIPESRKAKIDYFNAKDASKIDSLINDGVGLITWGSATHAGHSAMRLFSAEGVEVSAWHGNPRWSSKKNRIDGFVPADAAPVIYKNGLASLSSPLFITSKPEVSLSKTENKTALPSPSGSSSLVFGTEVRSENIIFMDRYLEGNMVAPSFFITRADQPIDSYGEITLLAREDLIKEKGVKIYNADAYSSRFPSVNFTVDKDKLEDVIGIVSRVTPGKEFLKEKYMRSTIFHRTEESGVSGLKDSIALQVAYAVDKGLLKESDIPTIKLVDHLAWLRAIKDMDINGLPEAEVLESKLFQKAVKKKIEYDVGRKQKRAQLKAGSSGGGASDDIDRLTRNIELLNYKATGRLPAGYSMQDGVVIEDSTGKIFGRGYNEDVAIRNFFEDHYDIAKVELSEDWFDRRAISRDVLKEAYKTAKSVLGDNLIDVFALEGKVRKKLSNPSVQKDFDKWAQEISDDVIKGAYISKVSQTTGGIYNKKLSAKVALSEMSSSSNEEGFNYGAGNIRASATRVLRGLKAIRNESSKLVPDYEMEYEKERVRSMVDDLANKLLDAAKTPDGYGSSYDDALELMADGLKDLREFYEMTPELTQEYLQLMRYAANAPTEYFEGKVKKLIPLSDMSIAVVPDDTPEEVKSILSKSGVEIRYYDPKKPASRAQAILSAKEVHFKAESANNPLPVSVRANSPAIYKGLDYGAEITQADFLQRTIMAAREHIVTKSESQKSVFDLMRELSEAEKEEIAPVSFWINRHLPRLKNSFELDRIDSLILEGVNGKACIPLSPEKQVRSQRFAELSASRKTLLAEDIYHNSTASRYEQAGISHHEKIVADYEKIAAKSPLLGLIGAQMVDSPEKLPRQIIEEYRRNGIPPEKICGAYMDGRSYVVTSSITSAAHLIKTIAHEEVGHRGVKGFLGSSLEGALTDVYESMKDHPLMETIRERYSFLDPHCSDDRCIMAEEFIAHASEERIYANVVNGVKSSIHGELNTSTGVQGWTIGDVDALVRKAHWFLEQTAMAKQCAPLSINQLVSDRVIYTQYGDEYFTAVRNPTRHEAASLSGSRDSLVIKDDETGDIYLVTDDVIEPDAVANGLGIKHGSISYTRVNNQTVFNASSISFWGEPTSSDRPAPDLAGPDKENLYYLSADRDGKPGLSKKASMAAFSINADGAPSAFFVDLAEIPDQVLRLPMRPTLGTLLNSLPAAARETILKLSDVSNLTSELCLNDTINTALSDYGYSVLIIGDRPELLDASIESTPHHVLADRFPENEVRQMSSLGIEHEQTERSAVRPEKPKKINMGMS